MSQAFADTIPSARVHVRALGRSDPRRRSRGSRHARWYRSNVMAPDDNPPIGILLCAAKDHALVEYALAGIDSRLFVSRYHLHLPDREQLQRELERFLQGEGQP